MMPARVRGWLLLAVVFAAGGAVGYAIGRRPPSRPVTNPMEPHAFVERLDGELGLDSAQRASITRILTRRQAAIDSAWRILQPAVRAAIDSTRMEIVNVLRPDQRPRYLELYRRAHGRMAAQR